MKTNKAKQSVKGEDVLEDVAQAGSKTLPPDVIGAECKLLESNEMVYGAYDCNFGTFNDLMNYQRKWGGSNTFSALLQTSVQRFLDGESP